MYTHTHTQITFSERFIGQTTREYSPGTDSWLLVPPLPSQVEVLSIGGTYTVIAQTPNQAIDGESYQ